METDRSIARNNKLLLLKTNILVSVIYSLKRPCIDMSCIAKDAQHCY